MIERPKVDEDGYQIISHDAWNDVLFLVDLKTGEPQTWQRLKEWAQDKEGKYHKVYVWRRTDLGGKLR